MKTYLCKVYAADSDVCAALVKITDEKRKDLLAQRELFQMVKAKDPSLSQLSFIDCYARYYTYWLLEDGEGNPRLGDEKQKEFEENEIIEISDELLKSLESGMRAEIEPGSGYEYETEIWNLDVRTELDLLVVDDYGFYWKACRKHSPSEHLETKRIYWDDFLKEDQPR